VIQLHDLFPQKPRATNISLFITHYAYDGQETGGQYEGRLVYSASPGVGMLSNGHPALYNVLPHVPEVDEADLPRTTSPGAGAITHYHNYSYYAQRPIEAGGEVLLNHGENWFREREAKGVIRPGTLEAAKKELDEMKSKGETNSKKHLRPVEWLVENGLCLDNLREGRSKIPNAGRGAFAARSMLKGSVVAPAPVLQIAHKDVLQTEKVKVMQRSSGGKEMVVKGRQLLLNYCFGHPKSSLLFYPYSPGVNLINHSPTNPNVALRWSTSNQHRGKDWVDNWSYDDIEQSQETGLMMEFVALRDIHRGEEITLDYGHEWETAWNDHVRGWYPVAGAEQYTPSYVMDDVVTLLRTEEEQRSHPYPDNIITSCFYRYSEGKEEAQNIGGSNQNPSKRETAVVPWKMTRGLFELNNLRPCQVIRREKGVGKDEKQVYYTAVIRNRYGLKREERIPKGETHIVTRIPRMAFRFTDKIYTTDQHLENAFRHFIGIPDDIFPEGWMDLA